MPILLKRKNGEITPSRNAEYISAFYLIPKSILDKCGEEINRIPRNPRKLLQDRRAIEIVESDLFKLVIIDAYQILFRMADYYFSNIHVWTERTY